MTTSYAQYQQALKDYEEKLMAIKLRSAVRQMRTTKFRLTQIENAQASEREQKRHEEAMEQQARTEAIQTSLRSKMGSRWL